MTFVANVKSLSHCCCWYIWWERKQFCRRRAELQIELLRTSNSYLRRRFCSFLSANGDWNGSCDDRLWWLTWPELLFVRNSCSYLPNSNHWSLWNSGAPECLPSLARTSTGRTCPTKLYKYKSKQKLQCGLRSVCSLYFFFCLSKLLRRVRRLLPSTTFA